MFEVYFLFKNGRDVTLRLLEFRLITKRDGAQKYEWKSSTDGVRLIDFSPSEVVLITAKWVDNETVPE